MAPFASFIYQGYGSFSGYDAAGQPTGAVGAHDMDLGLSYSRDLYHDERYGSELSAGVTGKWIREELAQASASAYARIGDCSFHPASNGGNS